jgi:hypothetical protein
LLHAVSGIHRRRFGLAVAVQALLPSVASFASIAVTIRYFDCHAAQLRSFLWQDEGNVDWKIAESIDLLSTRMRMGHWWMLYLLLYGDSGLFTQRHQYLR